MSRRGMRPRQYTRDQDQDSKNTVSRLSRDETVSRDFPSLVLLLADTDMGAHQGLKTVHSGEEFRP